MIDPFDARPLSTDRLDAAWRMYHDGSIAINDAFNAMEEAGASLREARLLLAADQPPSQGYLAVS